MEGKLIEPTPTKLSSEQIPYYGQMGNPLVTSPHPLLHRYYNRLTQTKLENRENTHDLPLAE